MCLLILKPALDSLHVCSFPQTTHGSTRFIACVFFSTNNLWINQWSLHVCSFHKPHVDPLESLHVCSFNKPHMDQPLESLHVCSYHKPHMDQSVVLACLFFTLNHFSTHYRH